MIYTLLVERFGRDRIDEHLATLQETDRIQPARRTQDEWERWGEDPEDLQDAAAMMAEFGKG